MKKKTSSSSFKQDYGVIWSRDLKLNRTLFREKLDTAKGRPVILHTTKRLILPIIAHTTNPPVAKAIHESDFKFTTWHGMFAKISRYELQPIM